MGFNSAFKGLMLKSFVEYYLKWIPKLKGLISKMIKEFLFLS